MDVCLATFIQNQSQEIIIPLGENIKVRLDDGRTLFLVSISKKQVVVRWARSNELSTWSPVKVYCSKLDASRLASFCLKREYLSINGLKSTGYINLDGKLIKVDVQEEKGDMLRVKRKNYQDEHWINENTLFRTRNDYHKSQGKKSIEEKFSEMTDGNVSFCDLCFLRIEDYVLSYEYFVISGVLTVKKLMNKTVIGIRLMYVQNVFTARECRILIQKEHLN